VALRSLGTGLYSPAVREVLHLVRLYSKLARPVVLTGPTGSGKGYYARLVHELSEARGPFVEVTSGQLTESLLHTQLFGHVSGAFTGAQRNARGAFEQAAGGTLFLDEIQHWSLGVQSALLHTLGEGRVRPIGAERDLPITCRTLFASTRGLEELVAEKLLLPDLRWRVAFLEIRIPPLSERGADILPLADGFLEEARNAFGFSNQPFLDAEVIAAFLGHDWPGNLRELRGAIEYAAIHASAAGRSGISHADLPEHLRLPRRALNDCSNETRQVAVEWMLAKTAGNRSETARRLGLHRNTISRRGLGMVLPADFRAPANVTAEASSETLLAELAS
jgi:DNA-binding NtrC family response regulator